MPYRLIARRPAPDFFVSIDDRRPTLHKGSGREVVFRVDRRDGFEGNIDISVSGLPTGLSISQPIQIEAGHEVASAVMTVAPDAPTPAAEAWGQVKVLARTMIDGSPYNRLIKVNDRPLAPDAERNERRKMEAEQKHRRAQSQSDRAKRIARYRREHEQDRAMLKEMAEAFNYTLVGQEIVKGRPAYVLEAAPKPGYVPKSRDTKVLPAMRGKLWIDQADKQWVRVEAEVIRPVSFYAVASVGPGTRFIYEQAPVNAGLWMPSHFEVRVNSSVFWMARNSSTDESYSNYRRISEHSAALP